MKGHGDNECLRQKRYNPRYEQFKSARITKRKFKNQGWSDVQKLLKKEEVELGTTTTFFYSTVITIFTRNLFI